MLDLDETLVYADESLYNSADYNVGPYGVKLRPHVGELLACLMENWDVAIWTSSGSDYGPLIVKCLGDYFERFKFIWTGIKCVRKYDPEKQEYYNIKDLKKIRKLGYEISDIVMVDDSPEKLSRNYGNLIQVRPWMGDKDDNELLDLIKYISYLHVLGDVTKIEKRGWQTVNKYKWMGG